MIQLMFFCLLSIVSARFGWISDNLVLGEHFKNNDADVSPVTVWGVFLYANKKLANRVDTDRCPLFCITCFFRFRFKICTDRSWMLDGMVVPTFVWSHFYLNVSEHWEYISFCSTIGCWRVRWYQCFFVSLLGKINVDTLPYTGWPIPSIQWTCWWRIVTYTLHMILPNCGYHK